MYHYLILRKIHEVTVSLSRRQSLISKITSQITFLEAFITKVQKNPIAVYGIGTTLSKLQAVIIQRCGKYRIYRLISRFSRPNFLT